MSYEEEVSQYRPLIGERKDFYCLTSKPGMKARHIRAMGVDSFSEGVSIGKFAAIWHFVCFISEGTYTAEFENGTHTAEAGELLIVPAGVSRKMTAAGPLTFYWVHFEDVPLYSFIKEDGITSRKCPDGKELAEIFRIYRNEPQGSSVQNAWVEIISEKYQRQILENSMRIYEAEFNQLWQKVRENPGVPWTVDMLCEELNVSRAHIHRLCAEYFNATPMEIISDIRLEFGAFLLKASARIIDEIAYECGFSSARSFSKAFLKKFDMRPGKFRKS